MDLDLSGILKKTVANITKIERFVVHNKNLFLMITAGIILGVEDMAVLLAILLPAFSVLIIEWFLGKHMAKGKKRLLWPVTLFSWFVIFAIGTRERTFFEYTWDVLLMAAVPILYAMLFHMISERMNKNNEKQYVKISVGYFILSMAIFVLAEGVICRNYPEARLNWSPDKGCYLVLLALIVYFIESKNFQKSSLTMKTKYTEILCVLAYSVNAVTVVFLGNERLRTVIFHMGGPAVNIQENVREDWIGYRLEVMKQFASGNLNADTYYMMNSPIERIAYKYGYISILIAVIPVIVLAWYLLMKKWENERLNRMKNYLAVSYLIRAGITILCCVLVLPVSCLTFPFFTVKGAVIDLLILYYLVREKNLR